METRDNIEKYADQLLGQECTIIEYEKQEPYHFCINCWRSEPDVEFYKEGTGYAWQYGQRCKLCERKYQQDFMEKYPNTVREHKLPILTEEEELEYKNIMLEVDFSYER